jgi:signal peptidase I
LCRPVPLAIIAAISVLLLTCVFGAIDLGLTVANYRPHLYRATGTGMEPTIHAGQFLTTQDYGKNPPQRADIIIFHLPTDRSALSFKRIIGLPGERVEVTDASVLINGTPLHEPYLGPHFTVNGASGITTLTLKQDQYYVLGDNRQDSLDSRDFGAVSRSMITAKVVAISK